MTAWRRVVGRSPSYGKLRTAEGELAIVDPESGLAQFTWPRLTESGEALPFDALLLTATEPEIKGGEYPDPATVATAWNVKKDEVKYFWQNVMLGIRTADDREIEGLLESDNRRLQISP